MLVCSLPLDGGDNIIMIPGDGIAVVTCHSSVTICLNFFTMTMTFRSFSLSLSLSLSHWMLGVYIFVL